MTSLLLRRTELSSTTVRNLSFSELLIVLNHVLAAPSELPVRKSLVDVFSLYHSTHIHSKAGVEIVCGKELMVCGIHVSGFYHGQLRGLLGTADSEPYDDFTLPNGKIVNSEADFGNAYKIGAGCPAVKTVDHHVHSSNPACNKLFGRDSSLRCVPVFNQVRGSWIPLEK